MRYIIKQSTTLLEALTEAAPDSSRNTIRCWLRDGRVLLDGKAMNKPAFPVKEGQKIEVSARKLKSEGPVKIIYEDSDLVVIDKPSGLLSVASNFETQKTAHAILKKRYRPKKVYVVHRLDQETSGVMAFALSEVAYNHLKSDLAQHKVSRVYYGIVEGHLKGEGSWTSYLYEDKNYYVHASDNPEHGERAVTHYKAENYHDGQTLVRFELETGKKNQIRVHTQLAGHPIVGDIKYGSSRDRSDRLCLHAAELIFFHPVLKKQMTFSSPLPQTFLSLVKSKK